MENALFSLLLAGKTSLEFGCSQYFERTGKGNCVGIISTLERPEIAVLNYVRSETADGGGNVLTGRWVRAEYAWQAEIHKSIRDGNSGRILALGDRGHLGIGCLGGRRLALLALGGLLGFGAELDVGAETAVEYKNRQAGRRIDADRLVLLEFMALHGERAVTVRVARA